MENWWNCCDSLTRLVGASATESGRTPLAWPLVNKHHMACHLALTAKFLNPETCWTYPYEDLMGRMKKVAMSSKSSMRVTHVPRTVMQKYRVVLHLSLEKAELRERRRTVL